MASLRTRLVRERDHIELLGRSWAVGRDRNQWASALLAWLAGHRNRLTVWHFGGRHLVVLVAWDRLGSQRVERDHEEVQAMRRIVNGPAVSSEEQQA